MQSRIKAEASKVQKDFATCLQTRLWSMNFIDLKSQYQIIKTKVNQRIQDVLEHGQYVNGPEIAELEKTLAEYVGVKHCIANSSGTDALWLALKALGIKPGDEVITTPYTFIATGEVISLLNATPVFVDIDEKTYNIDVNKIEAKITNKTKAIMPVSLYGQCADYDEINAIAKKHQLPVIEDAAQSFGARYKDKLSCGLTTIGCTSFFPSKPLGGYGDSGASFTDDDQLAQTMRYLRDHGQDRRYHHPMIGINGRMDTLQAAILLEKFSIFEDEVKARSQIGKRYSDLLDEKITTPFVKDHNTSVYAQYTIQVDDRDQVQASLKEKNIPTAVHYPIPLNRQPVFSDYQGEANEFAVSEKVGERVMSLPMHPYLSEADQDEIVSAINNIVA